MEWLLFALFPAFIWGILSLATKKILGDSSSLIHATAVAYSITVGYSVYFLISGKVFNLSGGFWTRFALAVSILGNISGYLVYNYAVKNGEVSEVLPITKLTPILTAFVAAFTLGENLNTFTLIGVFLASAGAFFVVGKSGKILSLKPEINSSRRGLVAAFGAAIIYSFSSTADRFAIQSIEPGVYTLLINTAMATGYTFMLARKPQKNFRKLGSQFSEYSKYYILWAFLGAAASLSIFKAFSQAKAALVTTVLQLQIVIPVVGGAILFQEENVLRKLAGSALIVTGIALTLL